ncbi:recombinase family protein [Nonomuraea bangladeshensis]|uniref:recombinase family protein n=1 Tax=Nonomuraea bangladeshensis TaxID=404385 RepID=UPI003C2FCB12
MPNALLAGIYARISDDQEGLALGVGRQEEDCRRLAVSVGATVIDTYVDNDMGASIRSRAKARPDFDRLLADVRAGRINAIVYYSSDRLTRRPMEFEQIISLVEETGVRLFTVASGTVDLSTADGRMLGRVLAAKDAAESEKISERVKRKLTQRRASGLAHGGEHITGWLKPDPRQGIGYCTHLDENAVQHIRQAAEWLLAGTTVTQVVNRWNEAGFTTLRGKTWTITTVQSLLSSPRMGGLISYREAVHGPGDFPSPLDAKTWYAIQPLLRPRGKRGEREPGYNARKHLLSGYIACGICACTMRAHTYEGGGQTPRYVCVKTGTSGACGKTSRNMAWLEAVIREYVSSRIALDTPEDEPTESADGATSDALGDQIAALETRLSEAREAAMQGILPMVDAGEIMTGLRGQIDQLRAQQGRAVADEQRQAVSADDVHALWERTDAETLHERRAILAQYVKRVMVHPLPKGRKYTRHTIPLESITIIPV